MLTLALAGTASARAAATVTICPSGCAFSHIAPALAAAIGRLIADPALKARLIERGRADYQRGYTREAVTRRMIALYTEIIAEHVGAGAAAAGERA